MGRSAGGIGEMEAMDEFDRCSVCARVPLVGEGITVLRRANREAMVCDLCLAKPRAAALGEEIRRDRVRTAAGAATVRVATPVAVRSRELDRSAGQPTAAA
jgi:hypothetical protein